MPAPTAFEGGAFLDPLNVERLVADHRDRADRHVIFADTEGDHRLAIHGADATRRPAVIIPFDEDFELRVGVLTRFYRRLCGKRADPPPRVLQLTPMRRARLILLLHTLDFRLSGARPREIAAALLDAEAAKLPAIEWKSSATRRKANRLIKDALALMKGGYRKLLRGG